MGDRYELALRQEILMERGADLLAELMPHTKTNRLYFASSVETLFSQVWEAKENILLATTADELTAIEDTFNLVSNILHGES